MTKARHRDTASRRFKGIYAALQQIYGAMQVEMSDVIGRPNERGRSSQGTWRGDWKLAGDMNDNVIR